MELLPRLPPHSRPFSILHSPLVRMHGCQSRIIATTPRRCSALRFAIRTTKKARRQKGKMFEEEKWTQLHFDYSEFEILSQNFRFFLVPGSLHVGRRFAKSNARIHSASALRITFGHRSSPLAKPIRILFFHFHSMFVFFFGCCGCRSPLPATESEPHSTTIRFLNGTHILFLSLRAFLVFSFTNWGRNGGSLRPFAPD